jgi:hypothetical protein
MIVLKIFGSIITLALAFSIGFLLALAEYKIGVPPEYVFIPNIIIGSGLGVGWFLLQLKIYGEI